MNSENSKTCDPHRPLINLSDKTNLKRSDKYVALSNLRMYYTWKKKSHVKTIILKHQPPREMKDLNFLTNHLLYQIFKIILSISLKNIKE